MGKKYDGSGLYGVDGGELESSVVAPSGIKYKNLKEVEPKALSDFVVCEAIKVEMKTAGGILLSGPKGTPFMLLFKVHSIGPELQMNKEKKLLKVGDNIMPIAPEAVPLQGSSKDWAIFHESQIKAVIVEIDDGDTD